MPGSPVLTARLVLAYFALLAWTLKRRGPALQGPWFFFLRAFFPNWKFFHAVGRAPRLYVRGQEASGSWSDWQLVYPRLPRRLSHPSRKTIGLRLPDHRSLQALLEAHGAPLLATTLILPGHSEPLNDAQAIRQALEHELAAVIDAGACPLQASTVIDLTPMGTGGEPVVLRLGRGELAALGLA